MLSLGAAKEALRAEVWSTVLGVRMLTTYKSRVGKVFLHPQRLWKLQG